MLVLSKEHLQAGKRCGFHAQYKHAYVRQASVLFWQCLPPHNVPFATLGSAVVVTHFTEFIFTD